MRIPASALAVVGVLVALTVLADDAPWRQFAQAYSRPAATPYPPDNQYTEARDVLGRALFFDPRLSVSRALSCASCHNPGFSWGDGLGKGVGHGMKELGRRTPTILNVAFADALFWDGRAATLEEQALGPIASAGEMNMPLDDMVRRLQAIPEYKPLFKAAYPGEPISPALVAKAIATFERTIVSGTAPFDLLVAGDDGAISASAKHGFVVFNTTGTCAACHSGWRFTDDSFHDIGVASADVGRGKLLQLETMQYAFKTPTLRNVDRRVPYMHDGSEQTLEDVIELYDHGGRERRPSLSPDIHPLGLSRREKRDLVAFLHALTSADPPIAVPELPR